MTDTVRFKFGGKNGNERQLTAAKDLVVIRTQNDQVIEKSGFGKKHTNMLDSMELMHKYEPLGIYVMRIRGNKKRKQRDQARKALAKESNVRFAGRVFCQEDKTPVLYTENIFIKFHKEVDKTEQTAFLTDHNLDVKSESPFSTNGYFVGMEEGIGSDIFQICMDMLDDERVEYCHPELIFIKEKKSIHPRQWHLKPTVLDGVQVNSHVNVEQAWTKSKGEGVTIAIIDDAIDIRHQDFSTQGKIVHPYNAFYPIGTPNGQNPSPINFGESHGTCCAGVACASGLFNASGVAPDAKLMPIKLPPDLGSYKESEAIQYAVDHGADIISCSWGPADGAWDNPNDPRHFQASGIPDHTREALRYAVEQGRNGKGCLILWAAGNGNESVELDGYASNEFVLAIAASNIRDKRSIYSDFGDSIFCCFPSNDFTRMDNGGYYLDGGIWATDGSTYGYNPSWNGIELRYDFYDNSGKYTSSFGGTSSATPGVAGIIALMLSANPELTHNDVRALLRQSCIQIDANNGNYDGNGHSRWYGYGKPDANRAVELALSFSLSESDDENISTETPLGNPNLGSVVVEMPEISPILRLGDIGEAVKMLQTSLNEFAYGLVVDGFFGRMTHSAVIDFQSANVDKYGEPLVVDGVVGPLTWWRLRHPNESRTSTIYTSLPSMRFGGSDLGRNALQVAIEELNAGAREINGNNSGEFVRKYLEPSGITTAEPWCAAFVSWCYFQASGGIKEQMPFDYNVGAKSTYNAFYRKGWTYNLEDGIQPEPGDIVVWHRGDPQGWMGHIGLVHHMEDGFIHTIEGNRLPEVKGFKYVASRMKKILGFGRVNLNQNNRNEREKFFLYS